MSLSAKICHTFIQPMGKKIGWDLVTDIVCSTMSELKHMLTCGISGFTVLNTVCDIMSSLQ